MGRRSFWQPGTEAQRAAVESIARQNDEGLVRSLGDGTYALWVKGGGTVRRYSIGADGAAELVSEIPPDPEARWANRMYAAGFFGLAAGAVLWMVLSGPWMWAGLLLAVGGIAVGLAGKSFSPNLMQHTRPGETWTKVWVSDPSSDGV